MWMKAFSSSRTRAVTAFATSPAESASRFMERNAWRTAFSILVSDHGTTLPFLRMRRTVNGSCEMVVISILPLSSRARLNTSDLATSWASFSMRAFSIRR